MELGSRLVPFEEGWRCQRAVHADVVAGRRPSTLLLVEHEPVYTVGRRTHSWERPDGDVVEPGHVPVVDVDRGGKTTWHGPGQLVGYPILGLADPVDVVDYVRRLEQALIWVCDQFGVRTGRVEGRSGVWLPAEAGSPERKIAAIGIRVQRGVTMHGLELNCDADMAAFGRIVPCGISDAGVTSLSAELGRDVPVSEALPLVRRGVLAAVDGELPLTDRDIRRPEAAGVTLSLDPSLR